MFPNEDDKEFYREAWTEVYNWLTMEDKLKLSVELIQEEKSLEEMDYRTRLVYLLNYIEIKYVNYQNRLSNLSKLFIDFKKHSKADILDLEISGTNDLYLNLEEITSKLNKSIELKDQRERFHEMLREIELESAYKGYINNLKKENLDEYRGVTFD